MNVFTFDANVNRINVDVSEILLVKEFKTLWDRDTSKMKDRVHREFTYIWLALDWKSIYSGYFEQDKHEEALIDSGLTQEEFDDPDFRAACRKYIEIQDENWSIKCLNAARNTMAKFIDYFNNVDPEKVDEATGKPIYKVKDIMAEITQLAKLNETLKELEYQVKKEKEVESALRGGEVDGYQPNPGEL